VIETYKNYSSEDFITLLEEKKTENENLKYQVNILQKMLFGSKQEQHKVIEHPEQTQLEFIEKVDLDLPQDIETQKAMYHRKVTNTKRTDYSKLDIPADLERVEMVIEPSDKTDDMVKIGEERTELLAIVPQKFYVKVITRPKYAKANKEGIVIAELPSRPIQGGRCKFTGYVIIR